MPTENIWKIYRFDFNRMNDEQIEQECVRSKAVIEEAEECEKWLEAVEYWKHAGRPRD